jgi:4-hydroxy-tetrahydrodipicolinate synthase
MDEISRRERLQQSLHAAVVTTVTPFSDDGYAVDLVALRGLVRRLVDAGIQTLIPCGNTGEFHSLTHGEWCEVVTTVIEETADRAAVIPAVGGPLADAVAAAHHAASAGATGVMVLPMHHTYITTEGTQRYYQRILDVGIPAIGYLRERTSFAHLAPIIDDPRLVGAKWAIPDVAQFANVRAATASANFVWSCGLAEQWAPMFWVAGATGFTSGLGNFSPGTAAAMYRALASGDLKSAMDLRDRTAPFEKFRARHDSGYNVGAVKEAMRIAGHAVGPTRPPLSPIADSEASDLRSAISILSEVDS